MYSIKAVSHATGLTVETLRAWERRHRVIKPQRDASGRRIYDADDVLRLRRLREATEKGHPIGRIADLSDEQLTRLLSESPRRQTEMTANAFVGRMLDAAEAFKPVECQQALTLAIALLPPADLIDQVLRPVLHEVGERWHRGAFSVAQERLVSACVRHYVALVLDTYEKVSSGPAIVLATLSGERHELGLLMSALVAAGAGWRCYYLGPDLPARELALFANRVQAQVVALSVVLRENLEDSQIGLTELESALRTDAEIWLGGAAAASALRPELRRCTVVADHREFAKRLELVRGT